MPASVSDHSGALHSGVGRMSRAYANATAAGNCVISRGFASYDQQYWETAYRYRRYLAKLARSLRRLTEDTCHTLLASQQLYIYAKWLARYTAYWPELDRLVGQLEESFDNADQGYVAHQSAQDGSWGWHYREFHHKFDASIVRLHQLAREQRAPRFPLHFLEPVSTPYKMRDYLEKLRISDIARTGRNRRDEYGGVLTCLAQLCFKPALRQYAETYLRGIDLDQAYVDAFCDFLEESQNPETGYWGPWYASNGTIHRYDDLSFTFHIVSYRKGDVRAWPRIIQTTFANARAEYPLGWCSGGQLNNHNNYDVAKIFRYGWHAMTGAERDRARGELHRMLQWCLTASLDGEGRFIDEGGFYNSIEACQYFGVSFLDEIGYFDAAKRFWHDRPFPEAPRHLARIRARIKDYDGACPSIAAAKWKLGLDTSQSEEPAMRQDDFNGRSSVTRNNEK